LSHHHHLLFQINDQCPYYVHGTRILCAEIRPEPISTTSVVFFLKTTNTNHDLALMLEAYLCN